jgi:hypothetical protein
MDIDIKPMSKYKAPSYPEKKDVLHNPILLKSMPERWKNNITVGIALTSLLALTVSGCSKDDDKLTGLASVNHKQGSNMSNFNMQNTQNQQADSNLSNSVNNNTNEGSYGKTNDSTNNIAGGNINNSTGNRVNNNTGSLASNGINGDTNDNTGGTGNEMTVNTTENLDGNTSENNSQNASGTDLEITYEQKPVEVEEITPLRKELYRNRSGAEVDVQDVVISNDPNVSPVFIHGRGRGSYGCVSVAPPSFLSEDEAFEVIQREAQKYGLVFSRDTAALEDVFVPANTGEGLYKGEMDNLPNGGYMKVWFRKLSGKNK